MDERALAGAGDAGDDDKHPKRDVDVDVAQVVRRRPADRKPAGGRPHRLLQGGPVFEMAAGEGAAGPQPRDGALERTLQLRRFMVSPTPGLAASPQVWCRVP